MMYELEKLCYMKILSMKRDSTTFQRPNEKLIYCRDVCKGTPYDVDSEGRSVAGRCFAVSKEDENRPRKAHEINLREFGQ